MRWFDRKFGYDHNPSQFFEIRDKLKRTISQLKGMMEGMPGQVLTIKTDNKWPIKKHLGHLNDLEPLWQGRNDDMLNGRSILGSTDLDSQKTNEAGHNRYALTDLMLRFSELRGRPLSMMARLSTEEILRASPHPILLKPLRTLDLLYFVAEHDDHHLNSMIDIIRNPSPNGNDQHAVGQACNQK